MKKIIMTGGGTAGHVTPNLALVPLLKEKGYEIFYIGSYTGIEKKLVEDAGITYYGISSGKLRRYHDWKNFTDPFRVIKGFSEANQLMKHIKPDVVFSKGGFVSVPVVMAAARQHIPAIIHESDMTPGLANKLAIPFASKVCCNFPETMQYLPDGKAVHTGSPIRKELFSGNREAGLAFTGFSADKPVILIMGGSIGSRFITYASIYFSISIAFFLNSSISYPLTIESPLKSTILSIYHNVTSSLNLPFSPLLFLFLQLYFLLFLLVH